MFLLNEILVFSPGRRQEAIDRLGWIHGLMASKPGFQRAIVAKYLGDGSRHTVLRMWDDVDAYRRFREGPDGNYGRGRPEGLYTNESVTPQWNSTLEWDSGSPGPFLVKVLRDVPPATWDQFAAYQTQMRDLLAGSAGVTAALACRATERDEALLITRFQDRAVFEGLTESPNFAATAAAVPAGVAVRRVECFEIVSERTPSQGG
jgi:heme-degrading monooxygenase HmoA